MKKEPGSRRTPHATDGEIPVSSSRRSTTTTAVQPRHAPHLAFTLAFTLLSNPAQLTAQELEPAKTTAEELPAITEIGTKITSPISDGTPAPPVPKPIPLEFEVLTSKTRTLHVVETPEMAGLPAPEGNIRLTIQLVKQPELPEPPLPALPVDSPEVRERFAELVKNHRQTELAFVSATVYNHNRTYFRCYPNGAAKKEICGWSNLDFNYFTGFASFQVTDSKNEIHEYALMMGIGNEDTKQRAEFLAEHDREYRPPEIPELPDLTASGPAYVITDGDTSDVETTRFIEGIHSLYHVEGARMKAAYEARVKAYEERKEFLLANPPKPKDVTIRYWKPETMKNAGEVVK